MSIVSPPNLYQQNARRAAHLKELIRVSLPEPGEKQVSESEMGTFRSIMQELVKAQVEIEKLLTLHLMHVKDEQSLQITLKMVGFATTLNLLNYSLK